MIEQYDVIVTQFAEQSLNEIADYIRIKLHAPVAASNIIKIIGNAIYSLNEFPERVTLTEEEPWKSRGIHKMSVKNYLVYFLILEEQHTVYITDVAYGFRNQKEVLENMPIRYESF